VILSFTAADLKKALRLEMSPPQARNPDISNGTMPGLRALTWELLPYMVYSWIANVRSAEVSHHSL
jgi:hypothetical protein